MKQLLDALERIADADDIEDIEENAADMGLSPYEYLEMGFDNLKTIAFNAHPTMNDTGYREHLADLVHRIWCNWMEYYMIHIGEPQENGILIPTASVERWSRQMRTPYSELTEQEKDSDRKIADLILNMEN